MNCIGFADCDNLAICRFPLCFMSYSKLRCCRAMQLYFKCSKTPNQQGVEWVRWLMEAARQWWCVTLVVSVLSEDCGGRLFFFFYVLLWFALREVYTKVKSKDWKCNQKILSNNKAVVNGTTGLFFCHSYGVKEITSFRGFVVLQNLDTKGGDWYGLCWRVSFISPADMCVCVCVCAMCL